MKYLFEIHHGIGDVVQMTGLIETIFKIDADADIGVIVNSKVHASVFEFDHRVKNIYYINLRSMSGLELLKMVLLIRKRRYDYAFFSPISNKRDTSLLAILINARISCGEQFSGLRALSKKYVHVIKENEHIVKRNNNVLLASKLVSKVLEPKLVGINKVELGLGAKKSAEITTVGICIGTSKPAKTWYLDRFLQIATRLEAQGFRIIFIGGKEEAERFPDELLTEHPLWENYMGKVSLLQSAALTKMCDAVIGGDTGIMHMAAAVGTPTVTLFSCSNPLYHAPYSKNSYYITAGIECQYCYTEGGFNNCPNYKCLDMISVDEVYKVVNSILMDKADEFYRYKY